MGVEAIGAIGSAVGTAASAVASNASTIMSVAKTVTSIASVGMGIYETVNGDTGKGLMMIAAGGMLGADALSSSEGSTGMDSLNMGKDSVTPDSIKSLSDTAKPSSVQSSLGSNALGSSSMDSAAMNAVTPQRSLLSSASDTPVQPISSGGSSMNNTLSDALKGDSTVSDAIAKQKIAQQNNQPDNTSKSTSTIGGLLSGVNGFIKDNKDVISMAGNALAYSDQQKQQEKMKRMDQDFITNRVNNNVLAPPGSRFDPNTGRML
jgi:hypothetical protein